MLVVGGEMLQSVSEDCFCRLCCSRVDLGGLKTTVKLKAAQRHILSSKSFPTEHREMEAMMIYPVIKLTRIGM